MVADCITNNSTRNVVTWLANQNSSNSNLKDQQSIFSFRNLNSSTSQNLLAAIAASNFAGIYNNSEKEEPVEAKDSLLLLNSENCSQKSTEKGCSKHTSINQLTETTFENKQVFNSPNSLQHSKSKIAFLTSNKQNNLTEVIVSAATEAIKIANTTLPSSSLSSSSTSSVESQHNLSKAITEKSDIMLVSQHATENPLMSGVPRWIDCINDSNPNHQFKSRQQQQLQNQQQQHLQNQQQQHLQNQQQQHLQNQQQQQQQQQQHVQNQQQQQLQNQQQQQQQQLQNQQPLQNQQQQTNHRSSLHNQYASNLNFNYKKKFHMPSNSTTNHSILSNASIGNTSRSLVYSKSNSTNVNNNLIVSTEPTAPVTGNVAEYMSASSLENSSQTEYNNIWNDFGRGDQSCSSHFYFASENETSILAQQSHAPNPPNSSNFHPRNWNEEYSLLTRKHMEKPLTSSVSAAAASASTRLPFSSVTPASNVSAKKTSALTHNFTWDRKPSQLLLQPPQNVQTSPAIPLLPLNIVPIRYKTQNGPQIMNVWNHNLEEEFAKIRDIVEHFQYVAIDTEFPGIVVLPAEQTLDYHYQTIKLNVDLLKIIQLGITFADEHGCTPPGTSTWQFNFKFNINQDMYAEDSIGVLKASGIDFATCERDGIDIHEFGEIIMSSGLVMSKNVKWISFHGSYDFGYLLKLLTCSLLPESETQFFELLNDFFPALYDIKYLLQNCSQLNSRISLQKIAEHLEVERVGQQHQAGSDSLLTCQTFFRLMNKYFNNLLDDSIYSGVIYGLGKAVNSDTDFLHYRSARCPPYDKQNKNSNHFSIPNPAVVPFKTMPATKNPHIISSKPYFS